MKAAALIVGSLAAAVLVTSAAAAPPAEAPQSLHLPPAASAVQTAEIGGKVYRYRATAGSIPVLDEGGATIAEVAYVSFVLDEPGARRPVTFAVGGGPGASSASLTFGLGPKTSPTGVQGVTPSTPIEFKDNPASWLPFTDLVFIDPVGTGFSRAFLPPDRAAKAFYDVNSDVQYLSGAIYDWLKSNDRMGSRKYLLGESYGGFRTPRMVEDLTWRGVGVSGLILVSPILDFGVKTATGRSTQTLSPIPWAVDLPSMAAANYERQGKPLTPQLMREVEDYARGEYIGALLAGPSDPERFDRMIRAVAGYTGLPEPRVRELGGRLEQYAFLRDVHRPQGLDGSRYDINWTTPDPFPDQPSAGPQDMVLSTFTIEAAEETDFVSRLLGWKPQGRYWPYNPAVSAAWTRSERDSESLSALRRSLALDPNLRLLIVHGYTDLACPYLMSRLAVDQMPVVLKGDRITLKTYPGGHMFYDRPQNGLAFMRDAEQLYR